MPTGELITKLLELLTSKGTFLSFTCFFGSLLSIFSLVSVNYLKIYSTLKPDQLAATNFISLIMQAMIESVNNTPKGLEEILTILILIGCFSLGSLLSSLFIVIPLFLFKFFLYELNYIFTKTISHILIKNFLDIDKKDIKSISIFITSIFSIILIISFLDSAVAGFQFYLTWFYFYFLFIMLLKIIIYVLKQISKFFKNSTEEPINNFNESEEEVITEENSDDRINIQKINIEKINISEKNEKRQEKNTDMLRIIKKKVLKDIKDTKKFFHLKSFR